MQWSPEPCCSQAAAATATGGLSSDEKLIVIQARADVVDFCALYQTKPSDLFDRSFEVDGHVGR